MNDYFLVTYYINWGLTGQKQIQQVLQLSQVNVLSMSSQGCYIVSVEKIEANPMFNTTPEFTISDIKPDNYHE